MERLLRITPFHITYISGEVSIRLFSDASKLIDYVYEELKNSPNLLNEGALKKYAFETLPEYRTKFTVKTTWSAISNRDPHLDNQISLLLKEIESSPIIGWLSQVEQLASSIPSLGDQLNFWELIIDSIEQVRTKRYIHIGAAWFRYSLVCLKIGYWDIARYAMDATVKADKENNPAYWQLESGHRLKLLFYPLVQRRLDGAYPIERWLLSSDPHASHDRERILDTLFRTFDMYATGEPHKIDYDRIDLSIGALVPQEEAKVINEIMAEARNIANANTFSSGALILAWVGYYNCFEYIAKRIFEVNLSSKAKIDKVLDEILKVKWYADNELKLIVLSALIVANHYRNKVHLDNYFIDTHEDRFHRDFFNYVKFIIDVALMKMILATRRDNPVYIYNRLNKKTQDNLRNDEKG